MVTLCLPVKDDSRQNEDGGVDEKGEGKGDGRIDRVEADRLADGLFICSEASRLHQRRMQIEIVRHHRRADDPDRRT